MECRCIYDNAINRKNPDHEWLKILFTQTISLNLHSGPGPMIYLLKGNYGGCVNFPEFESP